MTCDMWRSKLDLYADSELPQKEAAEVEAHLRTCASCASDALDRVRTKRMVRVAGARYVPSPQFRLHIEQSVRPKRARWRILSAAWWPKAVAACAAVILVAVLGTLWVRRLERERALSELADLHVTALASTNPVDVISTDRHTVKPWFAGKLPFTFNLPDLQGSPFTLVGGRLVYFDHSPGAQLLFEIRKHRLSVFILKDTGTVPLGTRTLNTRELAFNLQTWVDGGLRYAVVSDASSSDVRALAETLRRASP